MVGVAELVPQVINDDEEVVLGAGRCRRWGRRRGRMGPRWRVGPWGRRDVRAYLARCAPFLVVPRAAVRERLVLEVARVCPGVEGVGSALQRGHPRSSRKWWEDNERELESRFEVVWERGGNRVLHCGAKLAWGGYNYPLVADRCVRCPARATTSARARENAGSRREAQPEGAERRGDDEAVLPDAHPTTTPTRTPRLSPFQKRFCVRGGTRAGGGAGVGWVCKPTWGFAWHAAQHAAGVVAGRT